jgi:simple sugar transport system ATP-binding protein
VDFQLEQGSIHGLLGENGAGKTTLMNILYGLYQQEGGDVYIQGKCEKIDTPTKAISLGIGMVHQHFMLARPLSVTENIMLGHKSSKGIFLDTTVVAKKLAELSDKYGLSVDPQAKIWQLSVGEQQRVEILSTIYRGAEILILDEPTAVLTPQEVDALFDILRQMRDEGKSIILITHKLDEVLRVVDEVTVLRDGELIGSMPVTEETTKEELTRMMVGREVLFDFAHTDAATGGPCLEMINICANNDKGLPILQNFSLSIKTGEIMGLVGVDGNGQKELAEVITGLRQSTSGEIALYGKAATYQAPLYYIREGVAHIPEDRHHTGLAMGFSIAKNLIIKNYNQPPYAKHKLLEYKQIEAHAKEMVGEYAIKSNSAEDLVKDLSGGNQQKVILAREISGNPRMLIASQPTRGLDIGATEYVRERIMNTRSKGTAVLLISADIEEILQLSDRIAVIYSGKLMGILPRGANVQEIGLMMMGKCQEVSEYAQ